MVVLPKPAGAVTTVSGRRSPSCSLSASRGRATIRVPGAGMLILVLISACGEMLFMPV